MLSDAWLFDHGWHALPALAVAPSAREGHTAVYDPSRNRVVIFGGDSAWVDGTGSHRKVFGNALGV